MKTAIVICGGGMASSYSVGSILGLVEKFNLKSPDIVIAGSGSSGTASYYVSGQYDSIKNIWSNLLSTKKFISFFRFWKIIDIDYLIDYVFKKEDALNVSAIKSSKIDYYIAATNSRTADVHFFSAKNNVFEKMRATKAMPVVYGKKVKVASEMYCDTFLSSSGVDFKIKKAVELGAKRIIVLTPNLNSKISHFIFNLWAMSRGRNFYRNYLKNSRFAYFVPEGIELIEIKPNAKLPGSILDNSKKSLDLAIKQGYDDVLLNKYLKKVLA